MKSTMIKVFILFVGIFFLSCSASAQKQKTVQKAVIQTTINCDHCIQCETCGQLMEQTLLRKSGVQMITLNEKAMTITVIYNSKKTNLSDIKTAISKMGYDADDVKADPAGYEKLDGCCKV